MESRDFIPVYKPEFIGNEKKYLMDCIDSGWISSKGKYVNLFEENFSHFLGGGYSSAVSNGTVALHLALKSIGIKEGDEVIVPSFTYIASVNAIKFCNANPVFVDSDLYSWNIDIKKIKEKITTKTKAILAVHLYGALCDCKALKELCNTFSLYLVEDSAEAFGSKYKNNFAGTFGDISTFSFFGNKTITTGEGGMVFSKKQDLIKKVAFLKSQAVDNNREYWHTEIGYNYRITNMQAAIGLAQLENCNQILEKKQNIANFYISSLVNAPVIFQQNAPDYYHSYWMISILCESKSIRDSLRAFLRERNIDTRPHFYPAHIMPPYKNGEYLPNAEKISNQGVTLPSYPSLSESDLDYITNTILYFFKNVK